jgi:Ni/Co efflux regulator RcnB
MFNPHSTEENNMKKLGYVIAALGAIAVAAPSIASAEDMVIRHGDRHDGARAEFRDHRDFREHRDHGWRGHHDRMVIVKHRHHEY